MKAMILAAGKGERMRPLTNALPKPLIIVDGQPLIIYHLKALAAAGIRDVIINTWYLGEQLISSLGDGRRFGVRITYSEEEELLDTGGGIVRALPLLGSQPFIVLSADIFSNFAVKNLALASSDLAHLVMVSNPSYHLDGDFVLHGDKLALTGGNKLTYGNIGLFRPEFFLNSPAGAFPLSQLLRKHIASGLVSGEYYAGTWHNIGRPEDIELVNSLI